MRSALAIALFGIVLSAASGCASSVESGSQDWQEGHRYGQWQLAFDGGGAVNGDDNAVTMYPQTAVSADKTHACLAFTEKKYGSDVDFELTVNTEQQLRGGEPNPWEVGWVLWNYENNERFYALVLKPNGWELSKQDPRYPGNQRFLASGDHPQFAIGQDHRVHIQQSGNTVHFMANGEELGRFTDEEDPYYGGSIALYTEDARVRFSDLSVTESKN